MRVALFADIHGNHVGLKAVLADIARVGVDQLLFLGDLATLGPHPREVIDTVRALGCPCILGNHDEFLFHPTLIHDYNPAPVIVDAVDWCRDQLKADDIDYLRSFERIHELNLQGLNVLLCHGSPQSHMENILATTPPEELDQMLRGHSPMVLAAGHTHIQMLRQHNGMLIVNPGSVGQPFKAFVGGQVPTILAQAEYAILETDGESVSVTLHRVPLDKAGLCKAVISCDHPMRTDLLVQYS